LELQVWGALPLHPTWLGAQTPLHAPLMHVWSLHALAEPHPPAESHVWTPLPEHRTWPRAHVPLHTPLMHVWLVHATGAPHSSFEPHVSTAFPEHCKLPGTHDPVHCPPVQTPMQGDAAPHAPTALHDATALPWH
jgi:hypothetical protein